MLNREKNRIPGSVERLLLSIGARIGCLKTGAVCFCRAMFSVRAVRIKSYRLMPFFRTWIPSSFGFEFDLNTRRTNLFELFLMADVSARSLMEWKQISVNIANIYHFRSIKLGINGTVTPNVFHFGSLQVSFSFARLVQCCERTFDWIPPANERAPNKIQHKLRWNGIGIRECGYYAFGSVRL